MPSTSITPGTDISGSACDEATAYEPTELMDLGGWRKPDMAMHYRKAAPDDLGDRLLDFGWDFRKEARQIRETRSPLRVIHQA